MDKMAYAQAVIRIRVHETRLLDRNKITQMVEAGNAEEVLKLLQDTKYGTYIAGLARPEEYESMLSKATIDLYDFLEEVLPDKRLTAIFATRYDYHNLKVLLKGKALKANRDYLLIPIGVIPVEKLKEYIDSEKYTELQPCVREAVQRAAAALENEKDPQKMEIILDRYMYKDILAQAKTFGNPFTLEYFMHFIDLTNMRSLLRARKQGRDRLFFNEVFIEGAKITKDTLLPFLGESLENLTSKLSHTDYHAVIRSGMDQLMKSGKMSSLEKHMDNYLTEFMKKAKYVSFGPEPVLAYISAFEAEIKAIRMIIVGKFNHVSPENLRERLRDFYV